MRTKDIMGSVKLALEWYNQGGIPVFIVKWAPGHPGRLILIDDEGDEHTLDFDIADRPQLEVR